jgi:hypothetical protein
LTMRRSSDTLSSMPTITSGLTPYLNNYGESSQPTDYFTAAHLRN